MVAGSSAEGFFRTQRGHSLLQAFDVFRSSTGNAQKFIFHGDLSSNTMPISSQPVAEARICSSSTSWFWQPVLSFKQYALDAGKLGCQRFAPAGCSVRVGLCDCNFRLELRSDTAPGLPKDPWPAQGVLQESHLLLLAAQSRKPLSRICRGLPPASCLFLAASQPRSLLCRELCLQLCAALAGKPSLGSRFLDLGLLEAYPLLFHGQLHPQAHQLLHATQIASNAGARHMLLPQLLDAITHPVDGKVLGEVDAALVANIKPVNL
mmetsp:Transcript_87185/g.157038  ORF Transcript_87185/g.157038 Transcript_87185/m.157038 type:complete len:264 (+) Transcript_87185:689-1480(+)